MSWDKFPRLNYNDPVEEDGLVHFNYMGKEYPYDPHFLEEAEDFVFGWVEQGESTAVRLLAAILTKVARAGGEV